MKHIRKATVLALLGTLSLYGTAASAQDAHKWYAGAAVGQSKFNGACDNTGGLSCKETDTAWKFFGGYKFHPNFSAELGYTDFGKAKLSGTIGGIAVNSDLKANAWELDGIGSWPLGNKFSIYGKLGLYRAKMDGAATAAAGGISASTSASETNTGLTFGVGGTYDITPTIAARLEFQRYNDVGSNDVAGKGDLDVISIGALFKF
jgi:OOP family OmpA-OmpF porin